MKYLNLNLVPQFRKTQKYNGRELVLSNNIIENRDLKDLRKLLVYM